MAADFSISPRSLSKQSSTDLEIERKTPDSVLGVNFSATKTEVETLIQDATFTFPQSPGVRVMLSVVNKSHTSAARCQAT